MRSEQITQLEFELKKLGIKNSNCAYKSLVYSNLNSFENACEFTVLTRQRYIPSWEFCCFSDSPPSDASSVAPSIDKDKSTEKKLSIADDVSLFIFRLTIYYTWFDEEAKYCVICCGIIARLKCSHWREPAVRISFR